jgi:hypothetical protein
MQYSRFFVTNGERTIGLKAPKEVEVYLHRHFPPFAQVIKKGTSDWEIECFSENRLNLDPIKKLISVPFDPTIWTSLFIFRLIRNLFRLEYANTAGALFLHGGIVNVDGKGILYLGGKGAGKTSSILGMLSLGNGVSYACNDDAIIKFSKSVIGIGSARSVSIRRNTLKSLEEIFSLNPVQEEHPSNGLSSEKKYLTLYPKQLSETFGNQLTQETPIDAIVFPSIATEKGFQIKTIPPQETTQKIIQHLDTPIDSRHSFLEHLVDELKPDIHLKKLLPIPAFIISHSLNSVKGSANALRGILYG